MQATENNFSFGLKWQLARPKSENYAPVICVAKQMFCLEKGQYAPSMLYIQLDLLPHCNFGQLKSTYLYLWI